MGTDSKFWIKHMVLEWGPKENDMLELKLKISGSKDSLPMKRIFDAKGFGCAILRPEPTVWKTDSVALSHWRWANWGVPEDIKLVKLDLEPIKVTGPNGEGMVQGLNNPTLVAHFYAKAVPKALLKWLESQGLKVSLEHNSEAGWAPTESSFEVISGPAAQVPKLGTFKPAAPTPQKITPQPVPPQPKKSKDPKEWVPADMDWD